MSIYRARLRNTSNALRLSLDDADADDDDDDDGIWNMMEYQLSVQYVAVCCRDSVKM